MPRFVILRHETPSDSPRGTHWDLMLEADGVLRTWALAGEPAAGEMIAAERLADHRLAYLEYEGPISGNRGSVTQCDGGSIEWIERSDEHVVVALQGMRFCGTLRLRRASATGQSWLALLESDRPGDGPIEPRGL